ncbi:prenyltransferase/squalene oxidase repeat-containing protein [Streptomyces sp. SID11385]|uniref:prenyltransferase/squalene oxidase repeat-containing protein n=1 Tax=Streptomyces sp. SID11385 TaxID=2706031 RepID=UPI0013C7533A|nr:prenyltransferase/squalene oxidase repeat-containing protein [Streptomyces sp. SID11385]NEA42200.1 terpene cyclase/mutase family protein [Streptomyces sp. SID11385]
MNLRRLAAAVPLVATGALGLASAPALAASPAIASAAAPGPAEGLFGTQDPTYDGVWRQSLSLVALDTAGRKLPVKAVDWLVAQQCADGSFAPYRAKPAADCGPKDKVDTNQTGAAIQAFAAIGGHRAEAEKALSWLKSAQNKDGGWGYTAGSPSDANSTSVVIGALRALGVRPADVTKGGESAEDALLSFALKCDAKQSPGKAGSAFGFQPEKDGSLVANTDATAAAVTAGYGAGFVVAAPHEETGGSTRCASPRTAKDAARNGAVWLGGVLGENGAVTTALPGAKPKPDAGNTADTAVALAAAGMPEEAREAVDWLRSEGPAWAEKTGPAAWSQLILAAHATGADPADFVGRDLPAKLAATGPGGKTVAGATVRAKDSGGSTEKSGKKEKDDGGGSSPWWFVGVGLAAGAGIGFLLSSRNKRNASR